MAPKCPKCSTELNDDYGMVTCPSCGAIVFVDMEGLAHVAGDDPAVSKTTDNATDNPTEHENFFGELDPLTPAETVQPARPMFEDLSAPETTPLDVAPMDLAPMELSPIDASTGSPSAADAEGDLDMNAFLGYGDPAGDTPASPQNDPNDPLGISAYANSEMSAAKDGSLVITLIISGIDAKDIRDDIRQALQDSRFGWDTSALMSSIKNGVLRIVRVSPVKATVVVNRIKNLSVGIHWEQNAITEIDPPTNGSETDP